MGKDDITIADVKVIRSKKRHKTVCARYSNNVLYVYVPWGIHEEKLKTIISAFKEKIKRNALKKKLNKEKPLKEIAERINKTFFGGKLTISSIEYVTDQTSKFGCCNYQADTIRISHRIAQMPEWVRDYVVLHELAHLIEPNHSKAFWNIVSAYKLSERSRGYLMAKGVELLEETAGAEIISKE
jgi:predicted metal-dependent hydrolase